MTDQAGALSDLARQPTVQFLRERSVGVAGAGDGATVRRRCARSFACQQRGSDLHAFGTERQRRDHASGIGDSTGGNDGNVDGIDDLWNERERADERVLGGA